MNTAVPGLGAATIPPPLLYAGGALALVLLAWLLVICGRYLSADKGTRASIRQAWRIRRTWPRLARNLGLVTTDRTPTFLQSLTASGNGTGGKPEPRILTPGLSTKVDRYGVVVTVKTVAKVGLAEFQKHADHLADAWACTRVSINPDRPGTLRIRAVRDEPLLIPYTCTPEGKPPADLSVWDLGLDEYALATVLRMDNVPGVCVAGLPGYGKTSLISKLIAALAPSDAVQFAVADGKVSEAHEGDYADVTDRLFAFVGDDLEAANKLFTRLVNLRRARSSAIRRVLGTPNMWAKGPSKAWPLVVLVIDEAHTYFRDYKGSDPTTKKYAALTADNARLIEDLVKKGRSVGMVVIVATQKPTGDAIPTFIRDVCPVSLSFAQKTTESAVAALGEDIRNWPDANPVTMQDPGYVGVATMARQGHEGFTRVRIPYVDPADTARVAADTAPLTADPGLLLDLLTCPHLLKGDDLDTTA
ncbi:FtsK/SpoIIIE domain-containing protein [Streptomyces sp. TLI_171]|uniref:FtsK/SpoIIIE domain-containing protein n=1 Tax=Streptomyces sp. TLI_171 TaxID=1938859 RepID=UPI000C1A331D|nr:FtsK/SpoIIIE domain-containing protein [Streptomyces sp. TLI_171]RKE19990.1 S-DNA-T family DNA segregation ATPase FtsK/SpoIIIE [Streptomyces sp. TLI_171]